MGQVPLRKVTVNHLRRYRLWLEALPGVHGREHLATTTIAWVLGDAKNFLYWAEETGLVDRAPVPRRFLPRLQERPPDHLRTEELARLLAIPEPHAFVMRLALGTGMRWSELCRARADDLQDGMLIVHRTKPGRLRRIPMEHAPELRCEIERRTGRLCPYAEGNPGSAVGWLRQGPASSAGKTGQAPRRPAPPRPVLEQERDTPIPAAAPLRYIVPDDLPRETSSHGPLSREIPAPARLGPRIGTPRASARRLRPGDDGHGAASGPHRRDRHRQGRA